MYLGRLGWKDDVYYNNSSIVDNRLQISTRTFGTYVLAKDITPPIITADNLTKGKWISKYKYLTIEIEDEDSGIKSYRGTVNGRFVLFEYDPKTKMLVHDFNDNIVTDTENHFKLIVTDKVGNSTTFETTFFRKNTP